MRERGGGEEEGGKEEGGRRMGGGDRGGEVEQGLFVIGNISHVGWWGEGRWRTGKG